MIVKKEELTSALEYLDKCPELSVDSETTGFRYNDRAFSAQFANEEKSFYFDKRILGEEYDKVKLLTKKPRTYYFQNAKFDMRMLSWDGFDFKGTISDLEVLVRLNQNDVHSTSLATTAKANGMEKLGIVEDYIKIHKLWTDVKSKHWDKTERRLHYDKVPIDIMGIYAPHDTRITFDLSKKYLKSLDEKSLDVYKNECALTPVCFDMEMRGALIDPVYTEAQIEYESGLIREARNAFLCITGKVYDGSKSQLIDVFTKAGENIPKTATGRDSLTDDILESFTSPAAKAVQTIRYYEKRISTYYSSFLDLCDEQNRIHPDMRQAGTTTGRFSYRAPNFQNLSKEDEPEDLIRPNLIRRCFIPEPGHYLVSMDYSQMEYRLMLAYAKQHNMIKSVMLGADVHEATAQLVSISRKPAKTLNFAILFGAGLDKLATMLGISKYEAGVLRGKYFNSLPAVQFLIGQIKTTGMTRGYIYNWMGRKLHLPGGISSNSFALPNHLIQSSGADTCKLAMVNIAKEIKGTGIYMSKQVHDQLVFQWPKDQLDKIPRVKEIMEDAFPEKEGMRMKVDVSYSTKSFAEANMIKGIPC